MQPRPPQRAPKNNPKHSKSPQGKNNKKRNQKSSKCLVYKKLHFRKTANKECIKTYTKRKAFLTTPKIVYKNFHFLKTPFFWCVKKLHFFIFQIVRVKIINYKETFQSEKKITLLFPLFLYPIIKKY